MPKALIVDYEKCTGCGLCVMTCSFKKANEFNPTKARLTLLRGAISGVIIPNICWQCSDAPCAESCPMEALARDSQTGAIIIYYELCNVCQVCIDACPYGAIIWHKEDDIMIKCDLCAGDPECVKYCAYGALEFIDTDQEVSSKIEAIKADYSKLLAVLKC